MPLPTKERDYNWAAHEAVTVSSTAIGVTSTVYKPTTGDYTGMCAQIARCKVEDADIRWRQDGTDPTTTTGNLEFDSNIFYIVGSQNIKKFRAIRDGSTDATLRIDLGW